MFPRWSYLEVRLCQAHWSEHSMAARGRICRDGLWSDGVGWAIMSQSRSREFRKSPARGFCCRWCTRSFRCLMSGSAGMHSSVCTDTSSAGLESVAPATATRQENLYAWTDLCFMAVNWSALSLAGIDAGLRGRIKARYETAYSRAVVRPISNARVTWQPP